jgi:hypothetical protein
MKSTLLLALIFVSLSLFSQNVGIGTITPMAKLEVRNGLKSDIKIRSTNYFDTAQLVLSNRNGVEQGTDFILSSNREEGLRISSASDIPGNNHDSIMLITPTGRTGFNTTTPTETVDIRGNINLNGTIKAAGVDGTAGQVLMKNNTGSLEWGDMNEYKNFATFFVSGSWIVPAGVTKILVEIWGAGGGGSTHGGGGGGGYAKAIFPVTPGDNITYTIGTGGNGGGPSGATNGGNTQINAGSLFINAAGGGGSTYNIGSVTVSAANGGSYSYAAGFNAHYGVQGHEGKVNITRFEQTGASAFYEISSMGDGGDAGNTNNTGGTGAYRIIETSAGGQIRTKSAQPGRLPGGGGGGGYAMFTGVGTNNGSFGANGLVVIHY